MSTSPGIPQNFFVQTANQQNLVSWNQVAGATSYIVQRSLDNITFTTVSTLSGSPLATQYLDTAVTLGTQYWYQTASSNGTVSSYTTAQSCVPTPTGEMCLSQIRLSAMQRADRVNSNFVTMPEWRNYINQAMFELYDLLVTVYEDYYIATPIQFVSDGTTFLYPLPTGSNTFLNALTGATFTPQPFYKLIGVDLALNSATNAYVTVNKFNFSDRNRFIYPNTASTIYGVFNLQYRLLGTNQIEFIPTPSAGQAIRLWYIPRLKELLQDTDTTTTGISGWIEYVIVKAAYYALTKEESDTTPLVLQLAALQKRIEETAANRDAGMPDTISDVNNGNWANGWGGGRNGSIGGFALAPMSLSYNFANHILTNSIFSTQSLLRYVVLAIAFAYFFYSNRTQLSRWIFLSRVSNHISHCSSLFISHIQKIVFLSPKPKMFRVCTSRVIAGMTNAKAFINRTLKNLIRYPGSYFPFAANTKSRSSIFKKTPLPIPTIRICSFNNFSQKTIFNIHKDIKP